MPRLFAALVLTIVLMGCSTQPSASRPGQSPRDAEKVRAWGLAHGWTEVTPKATTRQQDEESSASGTAAGEAEADKPYQPTVDDRARGLLVFMPDRNRLRLRDQAPSVGEMGRTFKATGFLGEVEGFPVMVHATRDLTSVRVRVSDLTGDADVLPASKVQIREVIYAPLSLRTTRAKENKFQMWPMWLVTPQDRALKAGQGRVFWVTIRCPDKAGRYSRHVTVRGDYPSGGFLIARPLELDVRPIKLDTSLCSWAPVTGGDVFSPALCKQMAEHHMTGLSWWWGDYGLRIRREGDKAVIDPKQLDELNKLTKAAGMRGPWILFLGNMVRGHLELRLAGKYKEGAEPPLFPVKLTTIKPTGKSGVQPSSQPAVADLDDSAEMDRRYVEVLQSLVARAKEKGYPQIIICPYDEPTKYLFKHNAHWCELIRKHVPEIKVLNTPQGSLSWAKNLMPYTDLMDVQGADDAICDATIKAGKGIIGYSRLTASQTFAQARFDMGLRFAGQQPSAIYFWSLNFGHGDPKAPFNDLNNSDSAARHQFAWAGARKNDPWIETLVWEAQRKGAKDYLLTLMVQRALADKKTQAAERIRPLFEKFKADASLHPTKLDGRREQLVKWWEELTAK